MIELKKDVLLELKKHGYSTYRIRQEKLFSESMIKAFRKKQVSSIPALDTLCMLLNCQPGTLVRFVPDPAASPVVSPACKIPTDPGLECYQPEKSGIPHQDTQGNSGTKKSTRA